MGYQLDQQPSVLKLRLLPDSCEDPRILEMSSEVSHELILGNLATLARLLTSSSGTHTNVYRQSPAYFLCASVVGLCALLHPARSYVPHPQALRHKPRCWFWAPCFLPQCLLDARSHCRLDFPITFLDESPTQYLSQPFSKICPFTKRTPKQNFQRVNALAKQEPRSSEALSPAHLMEQFT